MQVTEKVTARAVPARMSVLPDQAESWKRHCEFLTWDQAREIVAASDRDDGARADLAIGDFSAWVIGPRPSDGVACLTPIPVPGRPSPGLIPLRKSAFRHVCAQAGAPAKYILSLPARLATACLSSGIQELEPGTARLLRLAGGEARALATAVTHRLICLNGMRAWDAGRARRWNHVTAQAKGVDDRLTYEERGAAYVMRATR